MFRAPLILLCLAAAAPLPAMQSSQAASREFGEAVRLEADATRGRALFAACVACHGADGTGMPAGHVPAIAGQHARVIVRQLIDYRHAQRWDPQMEQVASQHNLPALRDIADLAAFVSTLAREKATGTGDGRNASSGRTHYQTYCAGCHGSEGQGNGALLVPRLAGQNYSYLLRQFHDTLDGRRPNMPPPHPELLVDLGAAELEGLADHLSRLRPALP